MANSITINVSKDMTTEDVTRILTKYLEHRIKKLQQFNVKFRVSLEQIVDPEPVKGEYLD